MVYPYFERYFVLVPSWIILITCPCAGDYIEESFFKKQRARATGASYFWNSKLGFRTSKSSETKFYMSR
jgi:hypothetical protein